jgi:hypothetical protein
MSVEQSTFSPEEHQQIFEMAGEMVEAGEESIAEAEWYRFQILVNVRNLIYKPFLKPFEVEIARSLMHEAKVIGEVARQARAVLQFKGLDDRSFLDGIAGQQNLQ